MTGGEISGNMSHGVRIQEGSFVMTGGEISKNGGGVMMDQDTHFMMSGGTISKNKMDGVDVGGLFSMTGGSIINNSECGVNISEYRDLNNNKLPLGTVSLSGAPVISGNAEDYGNLHCWDDKTNEWRIIIDGVLKDGCKVGVSMERTGDFTKNYSTYNSGVDSSKFFFSDDNNYTVSLNSATGEAQLEKAASSASGNAPSGNTTSSRSSTSTRATSSSSSRSSSSSGGGSSAVASFSNGGVRSSGNGTSRADYTKSGKSSVTYQMAEVSYKASSAKVPATVKIGNKTYNVTSIASGAFVSYTKLKEVSI